MELLLKVARLATTCLTSASLLFSSSNFIQRRLSGSFHRYSGMDGMGPVMTSSPSSPMTGVPSAERASTFAPSARQAIAKAPANDSIKGDAERLLEQIAATLDAAHAREVIVGGCGAMVGYTDLTEEQLSALLDYTMSLAQQ